MSNEELLTASGFMLHRLRGLWINREKRMAFSQEAADDAPSLEHDIAELVQEGHFVFHFSSLPATAEERNNLCREILKDIGLSNVQPEMRLLTIRG